MISVLNKKKLRFIIVCATVVILAPLISFGIFLATPAGAGRNVQLFDFGQGQSLKKIAVALEERKVISSAGLFVFYGRLRGDDARVKAGYYQFDDGLTPAEILRRMVAGEVQVQRFAVPEGYSLYQIGELLEGRGLFAREEFLKECFNKTLLRELGISGKSVEGYLYPSTYGITPNMTTADFIRLMVAQFDKVFAGKFAGQATAARMSTREVVILASLIEKEAVRPEERPLISSVFRNRLTKGMPLQSDPTAVYGVRAFAGNVTKRDITLVTPYNTYLIRGLPPGPIGNPGGGAIAAALNPAVTSYLYFVAKKDGSHFFSTTLDEHNNAVRRYLKSAAATANHSSRPVAEYRNDHPIITTGK
jgi:UPF0755 protein